MSSEVGAYITIAICVVAFIISVAAHISIRRNYEKTKVYYDRMNDRMNEDWGGENE